MRQKPVLTIFITSTAIRPRFLILNLSPVLTLAQVVVQSQLKTRRHLISKYSDIAEVLSLFSIYLNFLEFEIFIDPTSYEHLELGTKRYPYKGLPPAFAELFNYLPVKHYDYSILIKEGTQTNLRTLFRSMVIMNCKHLTIRQPYFIILKILLIK